ncbi:threonine ammonia-lyase [Salinactinospora qingdaonensis]|uniref:Pyridoxal-phosphate dependent enzyme n=1 Tax=Salinactinospora qingdaonensis TaxID=702744 RepID=A0ABP7FH31_9ACTN
MLNTSLSLDRIEAAAHLIDPVFRATPQIIDESLSRSLNREIILKVETLNPIRSFKGRGADFWLHDSAERRMVICASTGNFGQGLGYAARQRGLSVRVFAPTPALSAKVTRMRELGARVVVGGADLEEAKEAALASANERDDRVFVEDGAQPQIAEGAATIAVELAPLLPDTVVVPVGSGALISGVATWLKAHRPRVKVIGAVAAGAPAMAHSWRSGTPVSTSAARTAADSVALRVPAPAAVAWLRDVVDDMVLIEEEQIFAALRLLRDQLGLIMEPAAALGLAAIVNHDIPGARVATVLTGSNFAPEVVKSL